MPGNFVREGYVDSERIMLLSWPARDLYVRSLITADDAGRLPGNPALVSARCWPLKPEPTENVEKWLDELFAADLIKSWNFDGKIVIQVMRWTQRGSSRTSKHPDPEGNYTMKYVKVQTARGVQSMIDTSVPTRGVVTARPKTEEGKDDKAFQMIAESKICPLPWESWRRLQRVYPMTPEGYMLMAREIVLAAESQERGVDNPFRFAQAIFKNKSAEFEKAKPLESRIVDPKKYEEEVG
jgi:hypothetical protein